MANFSEAERSVAITHLEQLKSHGGALFLPENPPESPYLKTLLDWTENNVSHIQNAVTQGAFSNGKPINWEITFLAFMESAATYLRDDDKLLEAVALYSKATDDDEVDAALKLYNDSIADIQTVAAKWNMKFLMICDLPWVDSNGKYFIGPYCGCFYSTYSVTKFPCLGIAFKGTNFSSLPEDWVDYDYTPFRAPAERLFGTNVSTGLYDSLFGKILGLPTNPFELIQSTILLVVDKIIAPPKALRVYKHVTGHSLGASYSCFTFAQLLIAQQDGLGDLYNFGCPRVGQQDWAQAFYAAMRTHSGISCRIVNNHDIVPQVPPVFPFDAQLWHIDSGFRIFPQGRPVAIPTERGLQPPPLDPAWDWPRDVEDHHTDHYYASLASTLALVGQGKSDDNCEAHI